MLFSPYLTSVAKAAACPDQPTDVACHANLSVLGIPVSPGSLAPYTITVATILSAITLIFVGAIADRSPRPTRLLGGFAWAGSIAAASIVASIDAMEEEGIIENARMMVGTKAIATLSTGYLNALEYAKERVQGADLTTPAKDAPRVTITHHPDVRRSLMLQKAYAEGLRALVHFTATQQDIVDIEQRRTGSEKIAEDSPAAMANRVNDLLLPIVKGLGSERAWVLLGTESLQTFGGSGFLQDYPIEQYVRDAKIDTLYEGTTAIQAQDFFFRKILRDRGEALGAVAGEGEEDVVEARTLHAQVVDVDVGAVEGAGDAGEVGDPGTGGGQPTGVGVDVDLADGLASMGDLFQPTGIAFFAMLVFLGVVIALILSLIVGLVFAALGDRVALFGNAAFYALLLTVFYTLSYALTVAIYRQLSQGPVTQADLFE